MYNINKPVTPHNTGQYLSNNFSQGRNEKPGFLSFSFSDGFLDELAENPTDYMNLTDDYCISGGSMTGKYRKLYYYRLCA